MKFSATVSSLLGSSNHFIMTQILRVPHFLTRLCKSCRPTIERVLVTSSKAATEDNTNSVVKTKVAPRNFAANTQTKGTQRPTTSATTPTPRCTVRKCTHRIWECRVFKEKSPTQRAKVVAEAKLRFSCLREKHMFM